MQNNREMLGRDEIYREMFSPAARYRGMYVAFRLSCAWVRPELAAAVVDRVSSMSSKAQYCYAAHIQNS